ncbi:MAG: 16S rRNA (uracil(1498)-N(3))-methyltransferase [Magnetococcus sp. DMHC-6]
MQTKGPLYIPMIPRLYHATPLQGHQIIELNREAHRYLVRVLRLEREAPLLLFDNQGGEWQAVLSDPGPPARITLGAYLPIERESSLEITLVQGLAKPAAMEFILQKGVELGVKRLIPLLCQRGVSKPDLARQAHRMERWQRIVIEATEQCGRTRLLEILPPTPWSHLAPQLTPSAPRYLFWEQAAQPTSPASGRYPPLPSPTQVTLLIGPEGGFTAEEVQWASKNLCTTILSLGPRILRTETAALAAITTLQAWAGDILFPPETAAPT